MWLSVVYSFIDNDTRHHSGQNLLRTHELRGRESYLPRQISQSDCEISSNCGKKSLKIKITHSRGEI